LVSFEASRTRASFVQQAYHPIVSTLPAGDPANSETLNAMLMINGTGVREVGKIHPTARDEKVVFMIGMKKWMRVNNSPPASMDTKDKEVGPRKD
jgi:hypothetical protein